MRVGCGVIRMQRRVTAGLRWMRDGIAKEVRRNREGVDDVGGFKIARFGPVDVAGG